MSKKPMSTKKFLKKKNKIVKAVTGVTLIPKKQIKQTLRVKLSGTGKYLNSDICPYCELYVLNNCDNCPMKDADNQCSANANTTWSEASTLWSKLSTKADHKKLTKLIKKYNKD